MSFTERYVGALGSSDLRDDEHHHSTVALHASASTDMERHKIPGSLLIRAKYMNATQRAFESGAADLAELQRVWIAAVQQKGKERGWIKVRAEWDIIAAHGLYEHIAKVSLAYWLDPRCEPCNGTGVTLDRRICQCCKGSKMAEIDAAALQADRIKDMVSELEGIFQAHSARASAKMRRAA